MLKRIVVFESAAHLGIRHGQLVHKPRSDLPETVIPIEDIGIVVIEHEAVTLSAWAVQRIVAHGATVVFCDERHMPSAITEPLNANSTHAETLRSQIAVSETLK